MLSRRKTPADPLGNVYDLIKHSFVLWLEAESSMKFGGIAEEEELQTLHHKMVKIVLLR